MQSVIDMRHVNKSSSSSSQLDGSDGNIAVDEAPATGDNPEAGAGEKPAPHTGNSSGQRLLDKERIASEWRSRPRELMVVERTVESETSAADDSAVFLGQNRIEASLCGSDIPEHVHAVDEPHVGLKRPMEWGCGEQGGGGVLADTEPHSLRNVGAWESTSKQMPVAPANLLGGGIDIDDIEEEDDDVDVMGFRIVDAERNTSSHGNYQSISKRRHSSSARVQSTRQAGFTRDTSTTRVHDNQRMTPSVATSSGVAISRGNITSRSSDSSGARMGHRVIRGKLVPVPLRLAQPSNIIRNSGTQTTLRNYTRKSLG
jgi:hypothetical protein